MRRFFRFLWLPPSVFLLCFVTLYEVYPPDADEEDTLRQQRALLGSIPAKKKPYFYVGVYAASEPVYHVEYADVSCSLGKEVALAMGGKPRMQEWLSTFDAWYTSCTPQNRMKFEGRLQQSKVQTLQEAMTEVAYSEKDTVAAHLALQLEQMKTNMCFDRLIPVLRWHGSACRVHAGVIAYKSSLGKQLKGQWIQAAGWSFSLGICVWILTMILGCLLGIWSIYPSGAVAVRLVNTVAVSVPSFAWGVLFLVLLYHFFPSIAWPMHDPGFFGDALSRDFTQTIARLSLPAYCIAWMPAAYVATLLRTSILEELQKPYVQTAQAKGLSDTTLLFKHVLKNAAFPVVTALLGYLPGFLVGSLVIEQLFVLPGLGRMLYQSFLAREYVVLLTALPLMATFVWLVWIVADVLYAWLDPRVIR